MNKKLEEYLELPYSTYVIPDETTKNELCYLAYHPELPGCMSHGNTPEEASQNLYEATALCISTLIEMGLDIPSPTLTKVDIKIVYNPNTYIPSNESNLYKTPLKSKPSFSYVS